MMKVIKHNKREEVDGKTQTHTAVMIIITIIIIVIIKVDINIKPDRSEGDRLCLSQESIRDEI